MITKCYRQEGPQRDCSLIQCKALQIIIGVVIAALLMVTVIVVVCCQLRGKRRRNEETKLDTIELSQYATGKIKRLFTE